LNPIKEINLLKKGDIQEATVIPKFRSEN